MTPDGLKYVLGRLGDAPDLPALRRVWLNLGHEYASHPDVIALKDKLKAQFLGETKKPETHTVILTGDAQRDHARDLIGKAPADAVVTIEEAKISRTKAQNRLLHRFFSDIERQTMGQTAAEIKAHCNLTYGRPILARDDPEWESAFGYIFDSLNHPAKLKAIRVLDIPFTRRMGVKQLTEYIEQMQRDYAEAGIRLTDPSLRGYEEEGQC